MHMPGLIKRLCEALNLQRTPQQSRAEPLEPAPSCVGCGFCCVKSPCPLAVKLYDLSSFYGGATLHCPALSWNGERHICANAVQFGEELKIGKGCRNPLNLWRREDIRSRL
jgi:hypothetical protein